LDSAVERHRWMDRAVLALLLVACCLDDAFAKWSMNVPECEVRPPGKIPCTILEP